MEIEDILCLMIMGFQSVRREKEIVLARLFKFTSFKRKNKSLLKSNIFSFDTVHSSGCFVAVSQ